MYGSQAYQVNKLYARARSRGRWGRIWALLSGRSRRLCALEKVEGVSMAHLRRSRGIQMVPIDRICGSEGRSRDFDCDFNPLRDHGKERWMGVAGARLQGRSLPPVALVQVGDVYFVRDGHHRVSVARALEQPEIEAEVAVWHEAAPSAAVPGVAPSAGGLAWQPA